MDYEVLMQQAIEIAIGSIKSGDVPVGALIVNEHNEILATGQNLVEKENDLSSHAEIVAMRRAAQKIGKWHLDDLTMFVTLEPCVMCAGAISRSRIKRLVFGAFNPKAGGVGSVWDIIRDPRSFSKIEVVTNIASNECNLLLKNFFTNLR
jgi:tRNA(adenine34) deaminase